MINEVINTVIEAGAWGVFWKRLVEELRELKGEAYIEFQIVDWGDWGDVSEVIQLPFFVSSVEDSTTVNWEMKEIPGMAGGLVSYTGTGARSFSFEFLLVHERQDVETVGKYNAPIEDMVKVFRLLTLPRYVDNGRGVKVALPPAQIVWRVPNVPIGYAGEDYIQGVVTEFGVSYEKLWEDGKPRVARFTLSIQEVNQIGDKVVMPSWNNIGGMNVLRSDGVTGMRFGDTALKELRNAKKST